MHLWNEDKLRKLHELSILGRKIKFLSEAIKKRCRLYPYDIVDCRAILRLELAQILKVDSRHFCLFTMRIDEGTNHQSQCCGLFDVPKVKGGTNERSEDYSDANETTPGRGRALKNPETLIGLLSRRNFLWRRIHVDTSGYCPPGFGANLISPPSEPKAILPESWTSKKVMKAM